MIYVAKLDAARANDYKYRLECRQRSRIFKAIRLFSSYNQNHVRILKVMFKKVDAKQKQRSLFKWKRHTL